MNTSGASKKWDMIVYDIKSLCQWALKSKLPDLRIQIPGQILFYDPYNPGRCEMFIGYIEPSNPAKLSEMYASGCHPLQCRFSI
jgi:hypothetical protein